MSEAASYIERENHLRKLAFSHWPVMARLGLDSNFKTWTTTCNVDRDCRKHRKQHSGIPTERILCQQRI